MKRGIDVCSICTLLVKPGQDFEPMADGGKCHKICFDIVCTGLAADIECVVPSGKKVVIGGETYITQ